MVRTFVIAAEYGDRRMMPQSQHIVFCFLLDTFYELRVCRIDATGKLKVLPN